MVVRQRLMDDVYRHIIVEDFHWLDETERTLLTQQSRTPSGIWKLQLFHNEMFYLGIRAPAPGCTDSAARILADWRKASPNSPTPYIAAAQRELDTAWCFRGSGYAAEVDDGAWRPFYDHLTAGEQILVKHKAIASRDPEYYTVMIQIYVAQGRSESELRDLLREGIARQPYYYSMYEEAFRYFEPQWFGSFEAEEQLASQAIPPTRLKDRTSAYARIYWHAMVCGCLPPSDKINRPRLEVAMRDLAELYPNSWNISHLARMACEIGDLALAKRYFAALPKGDDGKDAWDDGDNVDVVGWTQCRSRAASA